jgi:hypothetical protein
MEADVRYGKKKKMMISCGRDVAPDAWSLLPLNLQSSLELSILEGVLSHRCHFTLL